MDKVNSVLIIGVFIIAIGLTKIEAKREFIVEKFTWENISGSAYISYIRHTNINRTTKAGSGKMTFNKPVTNDFVVIS